MPQHPFQNFMVRYGSGERIFAEGDPGQTMYIVQSGRVRLLRDVNGAAQNLGTLEKGDFFGEMSILEGLPRNVGAEAVDDAELIEINAAIFDKMIRGNLEIAIRMLRKLSIRLREAELKVSELQASGARLSKGAALATPVAAKPAPSATDGARLQVDDDGPCYSVGDDTLIGRYDPVTELRPDIDLTDLDTKRTVSRRHARVTHEKDGYFVTEEVGALNGTAVNETVLGSGERHPLGPDDRLRVGAVTLVFRD